MGAEEEASRLREEFGDSYGVEELRCPKAQDDCWRVGPEQGAELMGWQSLGQDLTWLEDLASPSLTDWGFKVKLEPP